MHMFIYSKCFAGSNRKNVYTLPYACIYQKSAYITIHTKTACTAHFFRCRQQCAHTCICILSQKSAHPTIHTNLPAAVMKRRQNAVLRAGHGLQSHCVVCRQANGRNHIARCRASALPLHTPCTQFAGHTPRCRAQAPPAGHTLPLPRSQKPKKNAKILATLDV